MIDRLKQVLTLRIVAVCAVLLGFVMVAPLSKVMADDGAQGSTARVITIYDRGVEQTIITKAKTVKAALEQADIQVEPTDVVEPALSEEFVAEKYNVNVYRARPVVIVDGAKRVKTTTAAQSPTTIAKSADVTLYPEDTTELTRVDDVLAEGGAGLKLVVDRATEFTFVQYGKRIDNARTQAATVGEMLKQKGIKLGAQDGVSVPLTTPLTAGMTVSVWRDGKQTVTQEEVVAKATEEVKDADREIGYREVKTPGQDGKRTVTYEIEMKNGVEVSRKEIASTVVTAAVKEVVVVGAKYRGAYSTPSENEQKTWAFLMGKGLSREQTAGIMGNLMQEHGFNTTGDGLAQWTGSRRANLLAMADPYSIDTQLAFVWGELSGPYAKVLNNIRAQSTVEGAVIVFQNQYERCGICAESTRVQFAYNILASH